jgi:hypothetical protein
MKTSQSLSNTSLQGTFGIARVILTRRAQTGRFQWRLESFEGERLGACVNVWPSMWPHYEVRSNGLLGVEIGQLESLHFLILLVEL